jgi:hypothetical protein
MKSMIFNLDFAVVLHLHRGGKVLLAELHQRTSFVGNSFSVLIGQRHLMPASSGLVPVGQRLTARGMFPTSPTLSSLFPLPPRSGGSGKREEFLVVLPI